MQSALLEYLGGPRVLFLEHLGDADTEAQRRALRFNFMEVGLVL